MLYLQELFYMSWAFWYKHLLLGSLLTTQSIQICDQYPTDGDYKPRSSQFVHNRSTIMYLYFWFGHMIHLGFFPKHSTVYKTISVSFCQLPGSVHKRENHHDVSVFLAGRHSTGLGELLQHQWTLLWQKDPRMYLEPYRQPVLQVKHTVFEILFGLKYANTCTI